MSPTVLRSGPYRFFFYSNEAHEPPHIHVERDWSVAKFWLDPVSIVRSSGFTSREENAIALLVRLHARSFMEAWNEHFSE